MRKNRLRIKIYTIIFVLLFGGLNAYSQSISIEAENEPLNKVLIQLRDSYNMQFSFNDRQLSGYRISLSGSFSTPEQALDRLLKDIPFKYERSEDVYIIYNIKAKAKKKKYLVSGQVLDKNSLETLPYSHILINGKGMVTNMKGNFSYLSEEDSIFRVKVSYLGYFILDTILMPGKAHSLYLRSSVIGLKEVRIEGEIIEHSGQIGESPGLIRLNNKIARRVPGNGDNSIFNYLRLQPGILAAGEQSSNLIIWGGYEGHSKVLFDGFTIFGLKNFNDNISAVNPYMAKDIVVLKGGYESKYGERVSGIVDISGIEGSFLEPTLDFTINNMTISGKASLPLFERSSLVFAFRQTYYNLYDSDDIELLKNPSATLTDMEVIPDYVFRDYNFKYSGSARGSDNYYFSLYQGRDRFFYNIDEDLKKINIDRRSEEKSRQRGGSFFYDKHWKSGIQSNMLLSYSVLNKNLLLDQDITTLFNDSLISERNELTENTMQEIMFKNQNSFVVSDRHQLETGFGFVFNQVDLTKWAFDIVESEKLKAGRRLHAYVQDEFVVLNRISFKPGLRIDYPLEISKFYIQPRMQLSLKIDEYFKIYGAWGIYKQFVSLASEVDDYGNYSYFWTVCDGDDIPVLSSQHWVGGMIFHKKGFTASMETYRKTIQGITRYINTNRYFERGVYEGSGYSYGLDLYLQKRIKKHEFWISYSLGKTMESFPFYITRVYFYAPQDQRHEVKFAGLMDFHPFYFSANYVYGSGFVDLFRSADPDDRYPYNRLDVSLIYRYDKRRYHMEMGVSILNLLNTKNIKYSNFIRVPANQSNTININAEAVPFTPTVYLNFSF